MATRMEAVVPRARVDGVLSSAATAAGAGERHIILVVVVLLCSLLYT